MTEAAVEFLLENLKQLLLYNVDLIPGIKEQVESLYMEVTSLNAFLTYSKKMHSQYEVVREIVKQIRDVAYEAEDIIDTYVVNAAMHKTRNKFSRHVVHFLDYRNVTKEIKSINIKIRDIYERTKFGFEFAQAEDSSIKSTPNFKSIQAEVSFTKRMLQRVTSFVVEEDIIGRDEAAKTVVNQLTVGTKQLEVISVVGMGGLGKTTLASKIYADRSVEYYFNIRAWARVSLNYNRKKVFLTILASLKHLTDEMYKLSDERLADILHEYLCGGIYLIVLDDIWSTEVWDDLKVAFPNKNCGSRILLTSRNMEVAVHANPLNPPHHLRFLTDGESWKLLERKVFGRESCPSELEDLGKQISVKCHGLPLAVMVVGGLLHKKDKAHWKRVADSIGASDGTNQFLDILAQSYSHLPDHLKVCFLYFGVFPEDYVIPVWILLRLWVAEGFIQHTRHECLEDVAEEYLEDLIGRDLILVVEKKANGRLKSCRIHNLMRDLCLREAKKEKFLNVIQHNFQDKSVVLNYHRRLSIHSDAVDYFYSRPSNPLVRSFLCFTTEEKELPIEHTSLINKSFKLVRVLDVRSIRLSRFPNDIVQLIHLRYVAIFGNFKVLPQSICKLRNLQTLLVETTEREMDIQVDIWKMLHFRHLHTSGSSRLHGPPSRSRKHYPFVKSNMQTISTISPDSCTENIVARTPYLKKLGIRGKLILLMEEKEESSLFDNIARLGNLETLKLLNDIFPLSSSEAKLHRLPQWYKFPPNLKSITFSETWLDWRHMSTIGMLPNLEILKLKENAFMGHHWQVHDGGFRLLKVLQLGRTDLVQWDASSHHFPRLERVVLKHCERLGAVPAGLSDVSVLKIVELYWPTPSALESAQVIQEQKRHSMVNNVFKLLVYPPVC